MNCRRIELAALSIIFVIAGPMSSCSPSESTDGPLNGTALLGKFQSGMSPRQIASLLDQMDRNWKIIEKNKLPAEDPRPRFDFQRWHVESFEHEGFAGEAELHFFNDRLMSIVFIPKEPMPYFQELSKDIEVGEGSPVYLPGSKRTTVRIGTDYKGRRYAEWEDPKIREQMDEWLEKYALAAQQARASVFWRLA